MAIKALMLRKKIDDKKKELSKVSESRSELEAEKEELAKREEEISQSIEEADTDEEKEAVEEAVEQLEEDQKTLDEKFEQLNNTVTDLENEISELEADLAAIEGEQTEAPAEEPVPEEAERSATPTKTIERKSSKMLKVRTLRNMSIEAREAFVQREDVQSTLAQVREAIAQKRALTGGSYTIGVSILDLIRENVMEYSKLYKYVNVQSAKGEGRVPVLGAAPEAIWIECCDAIQEVDLAFGSVELDCFKVAAYVGICKSTAEDSDIDLLDAVADALMKGLGIAIDKAIVYGTGVKMPTGFITAVADDQTLATTNLKKITGSPTGAALFAAIITNTADVNPGEYSNEDPVWLMNRKTYMTLMANAVGTDSDGKIVAGVSKTMPVVGGDIVVLNFIPDNNIVTGFLDLYALLERLGITIERSDEVKFLDDQVVLKAKARMDGAPAIVEAFGAVGLGVDPSTSVTFAGES